MGGGPFLFSSELTTADCYFASFFFRVQEVMMTCYKKPMDEYFEKYSGLKTYWDNFVEKPESQVITAYDKIWAAKQMAKQCFSLQDDHVQAWTVHRAKASRCKRAPHQGCIRPD